MDFLSDNFLSATMAAILTFFYDFTMMIGYANYGLAIILLTVVIKLILHPLTVKQVKSMKAMQELQPKMKELQEKYKNNKEKLSKELTELYRKKGINPLAGCLPILIQMPFLFAIFGALRDYKYLQQPPSFLWVVDLSIPDPTYILPVLSALTTYIQQKQVTAEATQQTKMIMTIMPLFIGYISATFPSGLVLYWVMSNIIQIIQQWFMYRNDALGGSVAK